MDTRAPRALIADDEPLLAADLAARLARLWPDLDIAAVVHNGAAAVEALQRLSPEIAFLDVRMPGLSGLEVAVAARIPHLVFVTAYDEHAVAAFERAAADYLLKPVTDERLERSVARLKDRLRKASPGDGVIERVQELLRGSQPAEHLQWIRATHGQDVHFVQMEEVLYFRADAKYTAVQTVHREYLIRTPLKDLLPQLDPDRFWQIHRNAIVNISAVARARREATGRVTLTLRNRPETLVVSRAFAHRFKQM